MSNKTENGISRAAIERREADMVDLHTRSDTLAKLKENRAGSQESQYIDTIHARKHRSKAWDTAAKRRGRTRSGYAPNNRVRSAAIYWSDTGGDIRRANLDGTGKTTLLQGLAGPSSVALDIAGGKMYWTDNTGGTIRRANLDGTGPTTLLSGLNAPRGVTLDLAGGKMYWADNGSGDIRRANVDGTGQTTLLQGLVGPSAVALDITSGKIYWTDPS